MLTELLLASGEDLDEWGNSLLMPRMDYPSLETDVDYRKRILHHLGIPINYAIEEQYDELAL